MVKIPFVKLLVPGPESLPFPTITELAHVTSLPDTVSFLGKAIRSWLQ